MSSDNTSTHTAAVEAYLAELRAFLLAPNHGNGTWPEIPRDEFSAGHALVQKMVNLKWADDCDGDSPISFQMLERRRWRLVSTMVTSVTPSRDESLADEEARLMSDLRSLVCVASATGSELGHIERQLDINRRTRAARAAAFEVVMVTYATPDGYEHAMDRPVSLHLNRADAEAFDCGAFKRLKIAAYSATPDLYSDPTDNYADYRRQLTAKCNKVVPFRATFAADRLSRV